MRLRTFRAKNYKSLRETPVLAFDAGINVIVGQNNVGKTAILEGLSGHISSTPHRSLTAFRTETEPGLDTITFEFGIDVDKDEFLELTKHRLSERWTAFLGPPEPKYENRVLELFARSTLRFQGENVVGPNGGIRATHSVYMGTPLPPANEGVQLLTFSSRGREKVTFLGATNTNATDPSLVEHQVFSQALSRFYLFRAERLNVHRHPMGTATDLSPNASNLPEVLDNLQSNPARYRRYVQYVQRVFPHVHDIRVVSVGSTEKEIRAWMAPVETERFDLSFPLNNCGTGIGQVLAMLYVVLNSTVPRTLIIDEPNSFLHPGAVRELVRIFQENDRHQYIVSTHSPAVADATRPTNVHVLSWLDGETRVVSADVSAVEAQRLILKEVGASFADVFGAERVLWVEGKTEEVCIPRLLAHFGLLAARTSIIGVVNTGDFERKDADRVVSIYERLSSGALMPEKVAFFFDRESRTQQQRSDLSKRCNGRVHFSDARMFENYLLVPEAVIAVLKKAFMEAGLSADTIDVPTVAAKISGDWLEVDGAALLRSIFDELSGNRIQYEKVSHGAALLDEVLLTAPARLAPLAQQIEAALVK